MIVSTIYINSGRSFKVATPWNIKRFPLAQEKKKNTAARSDLTSPQGGAYYYRGLTKVFMIFFKKEIKHESFF
jgi:hypothetical protein